MVSRTRKAPSLPEAAAIAMPFVVDLVRDIREIDARFSVIEARIGRIEKTVAQMPCTGHCLGWEGHGGGGR